MIFTDVRFVLLLTACWATFFVVPVGYRSAVLVFWGCVFYAIYAGPFFLLVAELVVATYLVCRGRADLALTGAIILFFVRFRLGVDLTGMSQAGLRAAGTTGAVIIPLGFSFLAFELLHVVIEYHRGRLRDASFVDLAAFAFFFPCRIAGPIKRYPAFVDAVRQAQPSTENVYAGVVRILVGLFKKFVVVDLLALTVGEASYATTAMHLWEIMFAYSLQIYLDFSAYSDLAIGSSRVLGIAVPENFNWPYLSPNIQEFWNRWHMSLSSWARDYVFTPTGRTLFKGSLKSSPTLIAAMSYFATFLVIGAWHGLTPNFLVWGAYHGALVTTYHVYRKRIPASVAESHWFGSKVTDVVGTGLTFLLVTVGWVPFMSDMTRSAKFLRVMFGGH